MYNYEVTNYPDSDDTAHIIHIQAICRVAGGGIMLSVCYGYPSIQVCHTGTYHMRQ